MARLCGFTLYSYYRSFVFIHLHNHINRVAARHHIA